MQTAPTPATQRNRWVLPVIIVILVVVFAVVAIAFYQYTTSPARGCGALPLTLTSKSISQSSGTVTTSWYNCSSYNVKFVVTGYVEIPAALSPHHALLSGTVSAASGQTVVVAAKYALPVTGSASFYIVHAINASAVSQILSPAYNITA